MAGGASIWFPEELEMDDSFVDEPGLEDEREEAES
jgi:hypothetical protein